MLRKTLHDIKTVENDDIKTIEKDLVGKQKLKKKNNYKNTLNSFKNLLCISSNNRLFQE